MFVKSHWLTGKEGYNFKLDLDVCVFIPKKVKLDRVIVTKKSLMQSTMSLGRGKSSTTSVRAAAASSTADTDSVSVMSKAVSEKEDSSSSPYKPLAYAETDSPRNGSGKAALEREDSCVFVPMLKLPRVRTSSSTEPLSLTQSLKEEGDVISDLLLEATNEPGDETEESNPTGQQTTIKEDKDNGSPQHPGKVKYYVGDTSTDDALRQSMDNDTDVNYHHLNEKAHVNVGSKDDGVQVDSPLAKGEQDKTGDESLRKKKGSDDKFHEDSDVFQEGQQKRATEPKCVPEDGSSGSKSQKNTSQKADNDSNKSNAGQANDEKEKEKENASNGASSSSTTIPNKPQEVSNSTLLSPKQPGLKDSTGTTLASAKNQEDVESNAKPQEDQLEDEKAEKTAVATEALEYEPDFRNEMVSPGNRQLAGEVETKVKEAQGLLNQLKEDLDKLETDKRDEVKRQVAGARSALHELADDLVTTDLKKHSSLYRGASLARKISQMNDIYPPHEPAVLHEHIECECVRKVKQKLLGDKEKIAWR